MGTIRYVVNIGDKFNLLTVEDKKEIWDGKKKSSIRIRYVCRCRCGKKIIAEGYRIASGFLKSCGCFQYSSCSINGKKRKQHGLTKTPEYMVWIRMRRRCENPESQDYERYGARGISVCARWDKFENFLEDMGERPGKGFMIDRRNNDGNYEPSNCHWVTIKESNRNKSNIHYLTIDGETKGVAEWAEVTGINPQTVYARLNRGWSAKDAIFKKRMQIMERTGNRWKKNK